MKKSAKILALVLGLVMVLGMLVACGKKLSGTYELDATVEVLGVKSGAVTTFEFSGSKVTQTVNTYVAGVVTSTDVFKGTYEINEDTDSFEITITYTEKNDEKLEEAQSTTAAFSEDGETGDIKIGILTYKKK